MTKLTKILKERIEGLIDLEPYNIIRMRLILDNAIGGLNLMIADEMKNLDNIKIKVIMQEGRIRLERIKNSLDEFEMNALQIKINAETEILINKEKKIRNIIDSIKKSKSELLDLCTNKKEDLIGYIKNRNMNTKNLEKKLEKMNKTK